MKGTTTSGNVTVHVDNNDEGSQNYHESQIDSDVHNSTDLSIMDEQLGTPDGGDCDVASEIVQQPYVSKKRKVVTSIHDADKAFVEWLASKKEGETRKLENENERNDPDWLFLKSLLHDFKKLDDRRKRVLKANFMVQLNEQLDEAEREASGFQCSPCATSASSAPLPTHFPMPPSVLSDDDFRTASQTAFFPNNMGAASLTQLH